MAAAKAAAVKGPVLKHMTLAFVVRRRGGVSSRRQGGGLQEPPRYSRLHHVSLHYQGAISHVLLGMKKRGFGEGNWNGFGGKLDQGENFKQGASRELEEECGLAAQPEDLLLRGRLDFEFGKEGELEAIQTVAVYTVEERLCKGKVVESEEMAPKWFEAEALPFDSMWPDDVYWFPSLLDPKEPEFRGLYRFESLKSSKMTKEHLEVRDKGAEKGFLDFSLEA